MVGVAIRDGAQDIHRYVVVNPLEKFFHVRGGEGLGLGVGGHAHGLTAHERVV